jgi:hypothetical protein
MKQSNARGLAFCGRSFSYVADQSALESGLVILGPFYNQS